MSKLGVANWDSVLVKSDWGEVVVYAAHSRDAPHEGMNCDDAVEYVRKNVKEFDKVELSYHRIFTPGEVLSIETGECDEEGVCRLMVQVSGETIGNTVELDLEEIKDDLVEIKHMEAGCFTGFYNIFEECG